MICTFGDFPDIRACYVLAVNPDELLWNCLSSVTQEWRSHSLPSWMERTLILEVINWAWDLSWMHNTITHPRRSILLHGKLLERKVSTHIHPLILRQFKLSTEPKPEPRDSDIYLLYIHHQRDHFETNLFWPELQCACAFFSVILRYIPSCG